MNARIPVDPTDLTFLLFSSAVSLMEQRYTHGCRCLGCKVVAETWWRQWEALDTYEREALNEMFRASAVVSPMPPTMEGAYSA